MMANTQNGSGWRESHWRRALWTTAAFLLLLPAVAMRFTQEVKWDLADFAFAGTLLFGTCGVYERVARATGHRAYRAATGIALVAAFLLIWLNVAVGILGDESDLANGMYVGALAVGLVGALLARFQPRGMTRALLGTALAQVAVAGVALLAGWGSTWLVTGVFVTLWLTSARLFHRAARAQRLVLRL